MASGEAPPEKSFYLTFDDGFRQHYTNVFPVLKRRNIEAGFYVPTMPIEESRIPVVEKQRILQYSGFQSYAEFLDLFCSSAGKIVKSTSVVEKLIPSKEHIASARDYLGQFSFYSLEERFFRMIRNEILTAEEFELARKLW